MTDSDGLDVRALANAVLKESWARGLNVSNLKLQKLLFLCHTFFLVKTGGTNLVKGSFEAWQYGPVHREAYDAFRSYGDQSITAEALRFNPVTRQQTPIELPQDQAVRDVIFEVVKNYGDWSAGRLVELTHAKDGPWDYVVTSASFQANLALKISNDIIKTQFKYLWFGQQPPIEGKEPDDEKILIA